MSATREPPGLPLLPGGDSSGPDGGESTVTVVVAFCANLAVAVAKTVAALLTGSASMVAEAAHSWADTGNQVFLLVAGHRSRRSPDASHPLGYGREAYVWAMFAAMGLFVAGAAVSVWHGITQVGTPEPSERPDVAYVVLAVSFLFEGSSFLQAYRQTRAEARRFHRDVLEHALRSSDPTMRAVLAEDSAALVGLVVAALGIYLHAATGSSVYDAAGSIVIGLMLGVVAVVLIDRNRRFLTGQESDDRLRQAAIDRLRALPEVARVTYVRLEFVGPRQVVLVAAVDLTGEAPESRVAYTLRRLEQHLEHDPHVTEAVLTLSTPDEPDLAAE